MKEPAFALELDGESRKNSSCPSLSGPHFKMYQQVYFTVVAALAIVAIITYALFHFVVNPEKRNTEAFATFMQIVGNSLPPASAPLSVQAAAIHDWANRTRANFSLYGPTRNLIFGAGEQTLAAPPASQLTDGWIEGEENVYAAKLPDNRWIVFTFDRDDTARHLTIGASLFMIFLVVGIGIYPVLRKITRRLEDLQRGVSEFGEGNLSARVNIGGADEIGMLAQSFNRTAGQLESLVNAQKSLLANASHELRSPLARIQMALSLLDSEGADLAVEEIHQSVRDLDQLVGEILLASRLESGKMPALHMESLDLPHFLKEACASHGAMIECDASTIWGDRILLMRLMRNLLENAKRYGKGSAIEVRCRALDRPLVEIAVQDRGPGVPTGEEERIFEPFYRASGAREGDGGVGLGLALVRTIAQLHGGTVHCAKRDGGGSNFVVHLPQGD